MAVQLIAGYGLRLSELPDVTFGMSRDEVLAAWSGQRLHRPFVCGTSWSVGVDLTGVGIGVSGDDEQRLGLVQVSRLGVFHEPGREGLRPYEPVVFDDVDLFYWPAAEVADFLRACGHEVNEGETGVRITRVLDLDRPAGHGCFTSATLWAPDAAFSR
ncbi:hypothetical protein Cme02nite_37550 [Catellatospora methionotrophica]|uniref:Uncharacterized protein n=1 Tax=Catellatospora methionotrophica TaxID=121620 RepID=A0A8J3PGJ1_9ACTN|nr:hypothetical protein [Catellatospora methionotrophica]GIG15423.1 hypothetical protein Cme02nite_37550 [Catellatospora methionotrophica]